MIKVRFESTVIKARVDQFLHVGVDVSVDADVDRLANIIALDFVHGLYNPKREASILDLLALTNLPHHIKTAQNLQFIIDKFTKELGGVRLDIERWKPDVYSNSKVDFDITVVLPSMKNTQWVELWTNRPTSNVLEVRADGSDVIYYESKERYENNKFISKLEILSVRNGVFSMSSSGARTRKGVALKVADTFELDNVDLDFDDVPLWINNPSRSNSYEGAMIWLKDVRLTAKTKLSIAMTQHSTVKDIKGADGSFINIMGFGMPKIDIDTIHIPCRYHDCTLTSKRKLILAPSTLLPLCVYNAETARFLDESTTFAEIPKTTIRLGKAFGCTFSQTDILAYTSPPIDLDSIPYEDSRVAWGGYTAQNTTKFAGCKVEFRMTAHDRKLYAMTSALLPLDTLSGCDVVVNYPSGTDLCMVEVVAGDAYYDDAKWKFRFNSMGRSMGIGCEARSNSDTIPEQSPSHVTFTTKPNSIRRIYSMRRIETNMEIATVPVWIWECTPEKPMGKAIEGSTHSAIQHILGKTSFGCRILACSTKWGMDSFRTKEITDEALEMEAGDAFKSWVFGGNGTIITSDDPEVESLVLPMMLKGLMASGMDIHDAIEKKNHIDDRMAKFYRLLGQSLAQIESLIPVKKFVFKRPQSESWARNNEARPYPQ